jgi:hypothetical protein
MALIEHIGPEDGVFTGEDVTYTMTVETDDASIAGWTFSFMVKRRRYDADADAKVTRTSSAGISIVSASAKTIAITVPRALLAAVLGGVFHRYEVLRTNTGFYKVVKHGHFVLGQAVHTS